MTRKFVFVKDEIRNLIIDECAKIAAEMREKHGSPVGDAYSNGVWDQGVRIEQAIRALAVTSPNQKG